MKILKALGLIVLGAIGALVAYKESDKVKTTVDKVGDAIHKGAADARDSMGGKEKKEEKPESAPETPAEEAK